MCYILGMDEITIHRVGPEDHAIFRNIADGVFDHAVTPEHLARFLASDVHEMVVALHDGQIVGMGSAVVYFHPDKAPQLWINEVGTGDAWLRQGIATRVMQALLQIGDTRGCAYVWLGTEPDNAAALGLYRKLKGDEETFVLFGWGEEA